MPCSRVNTRPNRFVDIPAGQHAASRRRAYSCRQGAGEPVDAVPFRSTNVRVRGALWHSCFSDVPGATQDRTGHCLPAVR